MNLTKTEMSNRNLLDSSFNKHINLINFHISNTEQHELAKARVCYLLKKQKRMFVTEARFQNGSRADIFDLTSGVAYEVLHTEKEENLENKRKSYPCFIVGFKSDWVLAATNEELTTMLN